MDPGFLGGQPSRFVDRPEPLGRRTFHSNPRLPGQQVVPGHQEPRQRGAGQGVRLGQRAGPAQGPGDVEQRPGEGWARVRPIEGDRLLQQTAAIAGAVDPQLETVLAEDPVHEQIRRGAVGAGCGLGELLQRFQGQRVVQLQVAALLTLTAQEREESHPPVAAVVEGHHQTAGQLAGEHRQRSGARHRLMPRCDRKAEEDGARHAGLILDLGRSGMEAALEATPPCARRAAPELRDGSSARLPEDEEARSLDELKDQRRDLQEMLGKIGEVNLAAVEEHQEASERLDFYLSQKADLDEAISDLEKAIAKINDARRRQDGLRVAVTTCLAGGLPRSPRSDRRHGQHGRLPRRPGAP